MGLRPSVPGPTQQHSTIVPLKPNRALGATASTLRLCDLIGSVVAKAPRPVDGGGRRDPLWSFTRQDSQPAEIRWLQLRSSAHHSRRRIDLGTMFNGGICLNLLASHPLSVSCDLRRPVCRSPSDEQRNRITGHGTILSKAQKRPESSRALREGRIFIKTRTC